MEMLSPYAKTSHHNVRIIVIVTLFVTLCYPTLIDTAVIPERVQNSENVTITTPRFTEDSEEDNSTIRFCQNEFCGWAVYDRYTRVVDYFLNNSSCKCPDESYKCVRVGDDLSASAYVYRCRQNTTEDDIESPKDDSNVSY